MQTLLIIVLILLMIGVVVSLVRGIIAFLRSHREDIDTGGERQKEMQLTQNRMMMKRVMYQAAAIVVVFLLLSLSR